MIAISRDALGNDNDTAESREGLNKNIMIEVN